MHSDRARRVLFGTVAAVVSLAIALAALEVALRAYDRIKAHRTERSLPPVTERALVPSSDSERIYELRPGFSDGTFQVNDLGFADDPVTIPGSEGTFRIVVAGDSVACNFKLLPRPLGFADRLERRLRERGRAAEVFNLGVNGYSLRQTARTAEVGAERLAAHLVIAQISLNDPYPSDDVVPGAAPRLPSRLAEFVWRRSDPRGFWAWYFVERHYDAGGVENLREAFRRLESVQAGGVPVLAVLFPYLDAQAYERRQFGRYHALYADLAREFGVELLDLREPLAAAGAIADRWPQDPQHPDAAGHDAAAAAILERLALARSPESP